MGWVFELFRDWMSGRATRGPELVPIRVHREDRR